MGGVLPRAYFVDIFLRTDGLRREAVTSALDIYRLLLQRQAPLDRFYFMTVHGETLDILPPDLRGAYQATGREIIFKGDDGIERMFAIFRELADQRRQP